MSDQPKFNDKEAWKKIGNALMFIVGAGCFFFWLANGPLLPDPNKVVKGRTVTTIVSNIHPEQITGFAGWMLHSGLLIIGVIFIALAFRNQVRWRKKIEAVEREEQAVRTQARLSPINQLSGRRDKKKPQPDVEIEVNGQKIKLKPMTCDVGTRILPGDHRFTNLTFDKVIGQSEAKLEIQEFLHFLQHPDEYASLEAKLPRGVLMHGAHGTGKTMLARTLASTCNLPVIEIAGSEFVEMFVGVGASRVRTLFDDLDYLVTIYGGAILFIDEFDAVARARGSSAGGAQETESTLNQLLKEMDGIVARPRVFTFAATNRKDILDPAAIRPGRFDRHIEFFNPTRKDREALLSIYLPERLREADVNLSVAAKACPGASGAHVANIANEAKILTVRAGLKKVTQDILDEAVLKTMFGARRDGQRAVLTFMELDTVKVHESGHALVYMKLAGRAPLRFTIIPRGQSGGHVAFPDDFEMLNTKEHLTMRLAVLMGGSASTSIMRNGQEDSGISMDVKMATDIAVDMVTKYGMSPMGMFNLQALTAAGLVSDEFKARVLAEVQKLLDAGKAKAFEVIEANLDQLKQLIAEVDEHETLLEPDLKRIFNMNYGEAGAEPVALPAAAENK
ncbi:MAG: AAA family ATPase [Candidatus Obscuribacterales bacterium]|jgi:cell division protease FtsH